MLAEILHSLASQFHKEEVNYFPRPSLAGPDRCIRSLVYWGLKYPPNPWPGRALYVFDDGNWHSELCKDWIRKSAYQLHSEEMPVSIPGFERPGHIDGIVTDISGADYLLELKSASHFSAEKWWRGEIPNDYVAQVCLYILGLHEDNPEINTGILLIKNKNTAAFLEYRIVYKVEEDLALIVARQHSNGDIIPMDVAIKDVYLDASAKFTTVEWHIQEKRLPKRQYDIDHWRCSYCRWAQTCWEGYAREFEELKTDQDLPQDVADLVAYKQEVAAQRLELEKEEKKLTAEIRRVMKEANTREGRAGDRVCRIDLRTRETLDKSQIPDEYLKKATKTSQYEQLRIRKAGGQEHE